MIEVVPTALDGVVEIRPTIHSDERGFFSETWNQRAMAEAGFDHGFVQDNHSLSVARGTLRGLHFQVPPAAQVKLVRVSRGAIFDVAVDIRRASPTFGKWVGVTLSADAWNQLLIPHGFAHGFVTIAERTEVQYKVTSVYEPAAERTIRWDDPEIGIDWPTVEGLTLSGKDRAAPALADIETGF